MAQRKNFKRRFPPSPSRSPLFPSFPPPFPRHTPARSLGKTPRDPSCLVLRMKGSVYPALRHSHKGKIQSLLGRDPSLPNPDPGSTLFPSSSRLSPSTHQPFAQPLFQPPTLSPSVLSLQLSSFTNHQSLFFRVFAVLSSSSRSFVHLSVYLGPCSAWCVLWSVSLKSVRLPSPSTTERRVASPKATPSYKM